MRTFLTQKDKQRIIKPGERKITGQQVTPRMMRQEETKMKTALNTFLIILVVPILLIGGLTIMPDAQRDGLMARFRPADDLPRRVSVEWARLLEECQRRDRNSLAEIKSVLRSELEQNLAPEVEAMVDEMTSLMGLKMTWKAVSGSSKEWLNDLWCQHVQKPMAAGLEMHLNALYAEMAAHQHEYLISARMSISDDRALAASQDLGSGLPKSFAVSGADALSSSRAIVLSGAAVSLAAGIVAGKATAAAVGGSLGGPAGVVAGIAADLLLSLVTEKATRAMVHSKVRALVEASVEQALYGGPDNEGVLKYAEHQMEHWHEIQRQALSDALDGLVRQAG